MSKYNAKKVHLDGYIFDSQAEARRYGELKLMEQAGEITGLEVHPRFKILDAFTAAGGERISAVYYVADFAYQTNWLPIVEDVKGVETPVFRLKAKLFQVTHPGYQLKIVRA